MPLIYKQNKTNKPLFIGTLISLCRALIQQIFSPIISRLMLRKYKAFEAFTLEAIAESLQVNKNNAKKIYYLGIKNSVFLKINFFFISFFKKHILEKDLSAVELIGAEKLAPIVEKTRPLLFISMHMGDFPIGFLKLAMTIKTKRKIFVFKANPKNAKEDALLDLFREQSLDVESLYADKEGGRKAFIELRKGNIVIMLIDFETHVTSRANVTFFNKMCQMQTGPATLAFLSKAMIVPIINYRNKNGQVVMRIESIIDTQKKPTDEDHQTTVVRLTQEIASLQESWVRIAPSQVQSWIGIASTVLRKDSDVKILNPIKDN